MNSFGLTNTNLTASVVVLSHHPIFYPNKLVFLSSSLSKNGCSRSRSHSASYGKPCTQRRPRAVKRGASSPSHEARFTLCPRHFPGRITFVSPHSKAGFKICEIRDTDSRLAVPGQRQPRAEATFSHRASKPRLFLRVPAPSHSISVRMKMSK